MSLRRCSGSFFMLAASLQVRVRRLGMICFHATRLRQLLSIFDDNRWARHPQEGPLRQRQGPGRFFFKGKLGSLHPEFAIDGFG
eukprot:scaffold4089_cov26-Prasinocladus_malaysianus.AAC.4